MPHLPKVFIALSMSLFLASCSLLEGSRHYSSTPKYVTLLPHALQICEINKDPKLYFGKSVVIEGVYESDATNYAYIVGKGCPKYTNILGEGYNVPGRDLSVDLFQKEIKTNCVKEGQCITEAHIVVRGVIVKKREPDSFGNGKGMPLINITSVLYARFLKPQH